MRPGLSLRASSNETASSDIAAGLPVLPTDVRQFWLCRLNPMGGFSRSRSALSARPSGRLQQQRVAVDVDALRVAALRLLGAVGVEHRDDVQREPVEDLRDVRRGAIGLEVVEDVEERDRRRGLVAVHLRPQQHVQRPAAEPEMVE